MKHDYKAALREWETAPKHWPHFDTIRHALLLADKVTGEPSKEMKQAGNDASGQPVWVDVEYIIQAVIQQAEREVEV